MHRNRQTKRRQTHEPTTNTDFIREMELEALHLSTERNAFSEQAIRIKTDAMMKVEAEWEGLHSKGLSNQTKRIAAADGILEMNETYTTLVADIMEADTILKELAINISFERRQFSRETNHIADLDSIRASVNMLAQDIHAVAIKVLE